MIQNYDAIVVGSGHAGCEAALALARMNNKTLLLTLNLDSTAYLACNPSIGGTAKAQLVCEIDSLGGQMGIIADGTCLQRRMLNSSKGPAVQSLRVQSDKINYHTEMKKVIETTANLFLKQAEVSEIFVNEQQKVVGVGTLQGDKFNAPAVIICAGVYLSSDIIIGELKQNMGPNGFSPANHLTKALHKLGIKTRRFKTDTPVRVHADTIDYTKLIEQGGDENIQSFSFMTETPNINSIKCHLGYTNPKTHAVLLNNLDKVPMYNGSITGESPRYCPSIENKVVRFADKEKHQLFFEPEALSTKEVYVQGLNTSLPTYLQCEMVNSVEGLENAHIMRDAYAIEYDCIFSSDLFPTLEYKKIKGLYFAGQVNGTSGYEEAAAQGLMAGINASLFLQNKEPFILKREEAYIGVLIDDLVTKEITEPYRMMTSRAEYRLQLRQDNADVRLTQKGYEIGLVKEDRYNRFLQKKAQTERLRKRLEEVVSPKQVEEMFKVSGEALPKVGISFKDMLKRSNITAENIFKYFPDFKEFSFSVLKALEIEIKYAGYLSKQNLQIERFKKQENTKLPLDVNYEKIKGLKTEAVQNLNKIKPLTLGQAGRIAGVTPADVAVLTVYLKSIENKE